MGQREDEGGVEEGMEVRVCEGECVEESDREREK